MDYNSYKCTFLDENLNQQEVLFGGSITFSIVFNKNNTKDLSLSEPTNTLIPEEDEEITGLDLLWNTLSKFETITNLNFYIYLETEENAINKIIEIPYISNFVYRHRVDKQDDFLFEKIMEIG